MFVILMNILFSDSPVANDIDNVEVENIDVVSSLGDIMNDFNSIQASTAKLQYIVSLRDNEVSKGVVTENEEEKPKNDELVRKEIDHMISASVSNKLEEFKTKAFQVIEEEKSKFATSLAPIDETVTADYAVSPRGGNISIKL